MKGCYNADTLDDKSSDSSSPSEYWFCTPCLAHVDDPVKQNTLKNKRILLNFVDRFVRYVRHEIVVVHFGQH